MLHPPNGHCAVSTRCASASADHVQFGAEAAREIRDHVLDNVGEQDHISDPVDGHGSRRRVPRVSRYRMNVTALSQKYNLYFCAYQNEVHVFQPEREPQILKPPCVVLAPPLRKSTDGVGGAISHSFGHQVNHLIVGMLGNLEILLFNYDDGEVVGIYTHAIARYVEAVRDRDRGLGRKWVALPPFPKPFFHKSVGKSAWGLAIHQASRLIAVSSNTHEVTVFAFATSAEPDVVAPIEGDASPRLWCGLTALELERHFRSRTRAWRIVLPLGHGSHNVPAISFCDDADGNAFQVVAVDILGNTWFLNIWDLGVGPLVFPELTSSWDTSLAGRGWGVLVLSDPSFRPTSEEPSLAPGKLEKVACTRLLSADELLLTITRAKMSGYIPPLSYTGFPRPVQDRVPLLLGTYTEGLDAFPWMFSGKGDEERDDDDNDDDDDDDGDKKEISEEGGDKGGERRLGSDRRHAEAPVAQEARWESLRYGRNHPGSAINDLRRPYRANRAIVPALGETPRPKGLIAFLVEDAKALRKNQMRLNLAKLEKFPRHLADTCCVLRTTCTDVELQPFDFGPRGGGARPATFRCRGVLLLKEPRADTHLSYQQEPPDMHEDVAHRISMLAHVPELNLVVAGSLSGRVALITLLKMRKTKHHHHHHHHDNNNQGRQREPGGAKAAAAATVANPQSGPAWRYGFRVDGMLPRPGEEDRRVRPWCSLVGVAVSPVPGSSGVGAGSRRFRLIMHYMNHDILMYELSRQDDGDDDALTVV